MLTLSIDLGDKPENEGADFVRSCVVIDKYGHGVMWEVAGIKEEDCIKDIIANARTKQTHTERAKFRQKYGCVVEVKYIGKVDSK